MADVTVDQHRKTGCPKTPLKQIFIFNYTIIADDTLGFISSHQVNLTIQERSPPNVTTDAKELVVYQDDDRKIIWKIVDLSPARYWLRLNESQTIISPTPYHNGDVIEVLTNTTTLGAWNYTITANDTKKDLLCPHIEVVAAEVEGHPGRPLQISWFLRLNGNM